MPPDCEPRDPQTVVHPASTEHGETSQRPVADRRSATLMELAFEALAPRASVTRAVKEKEPASVGVPPTVPPVVNDRPSGSAPPLSDQIYGALPPVAPKDTPA